MKEGNFQTIYIAASRWRESEVRADFQTEGSTSQEKIRR